MGPRASPPASRGACSDPGGAKGSTRPGGVFGTWRPLDPAVPRAALTPGTGGPRRMDRHRNRRHRRHGPYHWEHCRGSTVRPPPSSSSPRSRDDPDVHPRGGGLSAAAVPGPRRPCFLDPHHRDEPGGARGGHTLPCKTCSGLWGTCEPASELHALVTLGPLKGRWRGGGQMGRSVPLSCGLTRRTPASRPRPPSLCRLVGGSRWQSRVWDTVRGSGTRPRSRATSQAHALLRPSSQCFSVFSSPRGRGAVSRPTETGASAPRAPHSAGEARRQVAGNSTHTAAGTGHHPGFRLSQGR